jgi:hypothetical protein
LNTPRNLHQTFRKIGVFFAAIIVALLIGEAVVRVFGFEWRFVQKALPYMEAEIRTHQPDAIPRILVRLKPSSHRVDTQHLGRFEVTVNSLGHRGPERLLEKPPGVFRILCVGGSNVYGAGISDAETWPAQLEGMLNQRAAGKFEVWNLGVSGYNPLQMAEIAEEAIERYDPDLVLFALSNTGPRFFFAGTDVAQIKIYFRDDPTLWLEFFPETYFDGSNLISNESRVRMLSHLALYRLFLSARLSLESERRFETLPVLLPHYVQRSREFLSSAVKRVKIGIFICPGVNPANIFEAHYNDLEIPVLVLTGHGMADKFQQIHPPPDVMTWYGENLVRFLDRNELIPPNH